MRRFSQISGFGLAAATTCVAPNAVEAKSGFTQVGGNIEFGGEPVHGLGGHCRFDFVRQVRGDVSAKTQRAHCHGHLGLLKIGSLDVGAIFGADFVRYLTETGALLHGHGEFGVFFGFGHDFVLSLSTDLDTGREVEITMDILNGMLKISFGNHHVMVHPALLMKEDQFRALERIAKAGGHIPHVTPPFSIGLDVRPVTFSVAGVQIGVVGSVGAVFGGDLLGVGGRLPFGNKFGFEGYTFGLGLSLTGEGHGHSGHEH